MGVLQSQYENRGKVRGCDKMLRARQQRVKRAEGKGRRGQAIDRLAASLSLSLARDGEGESTLDS